MQNVERIDGRAILHGTFRRNPHLVISQYRAVSGIGSDQPLPRALTVNEMIESILKYESSDLSSSGVFRAMAG
jgi:hypothetical protein